MDSMLSAIKQRRGGGQAMAVPEQAPAQGQPDMQGLVESLSPEQKQELMMLLTQNAQGENAIEQGSPSADETQAINQKIQEQAGEPSGQEGSEESDAIQASMLDRNSLEKAEAGVKPRGLGDRAKMYAAKKLKGKGKL